MLESKASFRTDAPALAGHGWMARLDRHLAADRLVPLLWRLLVLTALVDWLVTRTLTRFAIFMPKTPAMITGYQALTWLGQTGSTFAALMGMLGVGYLVFWEARTARGWWLAAPVAALAGLTLVGPYFPPVRWLPWYYLLTVAVLLMLGLRSLTVAGRWSVRAGVLVPALAMLAAALYQAGPTFYALLGWPGPPTWGLPFFRVGEGLVLLGAAGLWWQWGRGAGRRSWLVAGLPVLLISVAFLATPAMTATIAVWSHGVTLSLPWWLYVAALWFFGVTLLWSRHQGRQTVVWGLLLLLAAGYAPQLSSQFWFGVLGLWLLLDSAQRLSERPPLPVS